MSNTATMLQKVIGNDLLVLTYDRARKKLKSMHSPVNLDEYKNIVARVEVKLLIINNLNKELKSIEHQALKENEKLSLKPKSGPNMVKYEQILSQLRLVKILCEELKI